MNYICEYKYLPSKESSGEVTDRSLHGAFCRSDTVRFEVHAKAKSVVMEIHRDSESDIYICFADEGGGVFARDISMEKLCPERGGGLFWYRYKVRLTDGDTLFLGGESPRLLHSCQSHGDRQLLVYGDDCTTPEWMQGCVIYHIFVDRFKRSGKYPPKTGAVLMENWDSDITEYPENPGDPVKNNTFFGGDLDGVTEMLPYIAALGTELIYLSPVFESPSNHRYDTADYMKVDSMLGGDTALLRLVKEAENHGIKIMLDGVFNHTGSDSVYFNKRKNHPGIGAYTSKTSPYYEWYSFRNWPDDYECWWGVDIMPRVDSENPSWRRFILGEDGVIEKYMRMGVSGWRLDVCDELSDVFLDELRISVKKESPDGAVIGEVWEDATNKVAYGRRRRYLMGSQLDSVMNYPFRDAVIGYVRDGKADAFRDITEGIFRRYPEQSVHCAMNMLGTHDTVRMITALAGENGDGRPGSELAKMHLSESQREIGRRMAVFALGIMCVLPGALCVFYGDETGLEGYRDPFCRRPYPWGREDLWMIDEFRKIGQMKRKYDVLRRGEFEIERITADRLEIHRYIGERQMIAHFNRGDDTAVVEISKGYRVILGKDADGNTVRLGKYEAVFLWNG